jgi:hypothetical protein
MSRNSQSVIIEIQERIDKAERLVEREKNTIKWVKEWRGVEENFYSEPQEVTWENVEVLMQIISNSEVKIDSLNDEIWEGKRLIAKINSFF